MIHFLFPSLSLPLKKKNNNNLTPSHHLCVLPFTPPFSSHSPPFSSHSYFILFHFSPLFLMLRVQRTTSQLLLCLFVSSSPHQLACSRTACFLSPLPSSIFPLPPLIPLLSLHLSFTLTRSEMTLQQLLHL